MLYVSSTHVYVLVKYVFDHTQAGGDVFKAALQHPLPYIFQQTAALCLFDMQFLSS
jgi:hypothetical protein